MTKDKRIIVVSGPSGAGKDTLIGRALEEASGLYFAVSATTRDPRKGETDGVDYYFVTDSEFRHKEDQGDFLEHKEVFNNRYGTLMSEAEKGWNRGMDVLLELDVKGALTVKEKYPEATLVFVAPPSLDELRERIKCRDLNDEKEVERRLEVAPWEIAVGIKGFDHVIINDELEKATEELIGILKSR